MKLLRLLVAISCLLLCGRVWADVQAAPETPGSLIAGISAKNYPRTGGSTSTFPLAQLLLARALGLEAELRRIPPYSFAPEVSTLSLSFPRDTSLAQLADFTRLLRLNPHSGTHESYEALIKGELDVILVARAPSPDETRLAAQKKIALAVRPIARDALVFVVNQTNVVRGLKREQLRDIYAGKTVNWKTLGGRDEPIRAYTRDRNSGSEELMRALLQKDRPMIDGGEQMISSMVGLLNAVRRNPRGLGYSIWYFQSVMNPHEGTRTLAVDGVLPSRASIADGTYPLVAPVYVVTRGDAPADAPAALVRDWLTGDQGQKLVAQSGNIPLP